MNDALNNPAKRSYNRREINPGDIPLGQKPDIDMENLAAERGAGLIDIVPGIDKNAEQLAKLAFNEEPITIRIEQNSRSEFPEMYAPCYNQGKGAEVFQNGKWIELGWLPIGQIIVTKRKYVEQYARSKTEHIKTVAEGTEVKRPRNMIQRRSTSNFPISIIEDRNPRGAEWFSRILMGY